MYLDFHLNCLKTAKKKNGFIQHAHIVCFCLTSCKILSNSSLIFKAGRLLSGRGLIHSFIAVITPLSINVSFRSCLKDKNTKIHTDLLVYYTHQTFYQKHASFQRGKQTTVYKQKQPHCCVSERSTIQISSQWCICWSLQMGYREAAKLCRNRLYGGCF